MEKKFTEYIDTLLTENRLPFITSKENAKQKVLSRISLEERNVVPIRRKNSILFWSAAAAAVLMIVSLTFFGINKEVNDTPTIAITSLPDGSEIYLDQNSSLEYSPLFWGVDRSVTLSGKAFFEVTKGETFTVKTNLGEVVVLGTSFTVSDSDEKLLVACKTGKVRVTDSEMKESFDLLPGETFKKTIGSEAGIVKRSPENIGLWISGSYSFKDVPLTEVFETLEEVSGYTIEASGIGESRYSGEFQKDQRLEDILTILCKPFSLEFTVNHKRRIIQITKS